MLDVASLRTALESVIEEEGSGCAGIEVVVGFMVPLCSPFSAEEAGIRVVRVTGDVAMIVGWVVPVMIIKGIVAQRCRVIKGGGSMGWKLRGKGRL